MEIGEFRVCEEMRAVRYNQLQLVWSLGWQFSSVRCAKYKSNVYNWFLSNLLKILLPGFEPLRYHR